MTEDLKVEFHELWQFAGERTKISKKSRVENKTRMGKMRDDVRH